MTIALASPLWSNMYGTVWYIYCTLQQQTEGLDMFGHGDPKPLWPAILFLPMLCIGLLILRESFLYRIRARARYGARERKWGNSATGRTS